MTTLTIDHALQRAIEHHQAGQLQDAERLYRAILQTQPDHSDANHNLGVLAVQVKQPAAGLSHFKAAVEAKPDQGQYWLSYIDALFQADQVDVARQVLEQGRQRGLQGEAVETLAARMVERATAVEQADTDPHTLKESLSSSLEAKQRSGKITKAKSSKLDMKATLHKKAPSSQKLNELAALFAGGRYADAEILALEMTNHFPLHGIGWKALGNR